MGSLTVQRVRLPLRAPLVAAWGSLAERELVRVRLSLGGHWGLGEAAPLEPYDGVPMAAVLAALDAYGEVVADEPDALLDADTSVVAHDPGALLVACRAERDLPQALAAIDLALWDLEGRRSGRPVAELLGAAPLPVVVNALIGAEDRAGAAHAAAEAASAGYRCVKVKVGIGDDAGRLAAVRAAVGPDVAIRADANGAWRSVREALANLRALAPVGLELCEEPLHGVDALRELRAESPVPIALDESAAEPGAAGSGAADAVCLKISRCGGIGGVLRDAAAARDAGSAVYLASTFDGPLGVAAALHAAAALQFTGELLPCGLATLGAFEDVSAPELLDGALAPPPGPGLGSWGP